MQHLVDLVGVHRVRDAHAKLEINEPDQQRIERTSSRRKLLRDLGEWLTVGDHPRDSVGLAASPLRRPHGGGALGGQRDAHGET